MNSNLTDLTFERYFPSPYETDTESAGMFKDENFYVYRARFKYHGEAGLCFLHISRILSEDAIALATIIQSLCEDSASVSWLEREENMRPHTKTEMNEYGAIIGYKYLLNLPERLCVLGQPMFFSPLHPGNGIWHNDELTSDKIPALDNTNGIYAAKTRNSPSLDSIGVLNQDVLVRVRLDGVVLEYEYGFRAEHATILEVLT